MKLSKDLDDALETISKEVDSWPAWKRSIDINESKKLPKTSEGKPTGNRKTAQLARAAQA